MRKVVVEGVEADAVADVAVAALLGLHLRHQVLRLHHLRVLPVAHVVVPEIGVVYLLISGGQVGSLLRKQKRLWLRRWQNTWRGGHL